MMCTANHMEQGGCRAEGIHAVHVAGYGKDRVTWRNESFKPPPRALTKAELDELGKQITETLS